MEDVDISLGDVSKGLGAAAKLSKTLPGMSNKVSPGSAEPATCPTCNQRIVTTQPGGANAVDTLTKGLETADKAVGCCNNAMDCFGKVSDLTEES